MCLCEDNSTDESWLKVEILDSLDIEEAALIKSANFRKKMVFRVSNAIIE